MGEDFGAAEHIDDEDQRLGHEGLLREVEGHAEVGIVAILLCVPGGDHEKGGEDEIDGASYAGIVERLGKSVIGRRLNVMSDADCHDEHDRSDVPANDRDGLRYGEGKAMSSGGERDSQ